MPIFDKDTNIESITKTVIEMRFKIDQLTNVVMKISEKMDSIIELLRTSKNLGNEIPTEENETPTEFEFRFREPEDDEK